MIGFFDSGFGGLTILKEVARKLPIYSYIYFGDNARSPYGSLSEEEIYFNTCQGVEFLFRQGAQLVILACNTSSAVALRKMQQAYLPTFHPDKKVLGIIIPTAEKMEGINNIGIFATQATVSSNAYKSEILKINKNAQVIQIACPQIVPKIEDGKLDELDEIIKDYVAQLLSKRTNCNSIILGCTHYAIVETLFRKYLASAPIVSQGIVIADSLKKYLEKHSEIEKHLERIGDRVFFSSGEGEKISKLAAFFYEEDIQVKKCIVD